MNDGVTMKLELQLHLNKSLLSFRQRTMKKKSNEVKNGNQM